MEKLLSGIYSLMIDFEVVNKSQNEYAPLVFAIGCGIIGFLFVCADLSFYVLNKESLLLLKHSWRNTFGFLLAWAFGAAFFGYVGQFLNIFQVSLLSCATVGVSWPILLTKALSKLREKSEEQQLTTEE